MKIPGPDHPIDVAPLVGRVRVIWNGEMIAESDSALELREADYPSVAYIPRADVAMDKLEPSDHQTYCPYKGDASYFNIEAGGKRSENAVWSYTEPYAAFEIIKDYVAFYPDRVDAIERSASQETALMSTPTLDQPAVQSVLEREHARSKEDGAKMAAVRPHMEAEKARGLSTGEINTLYPKDVYLSITPDMGRFLYLAALSQGARAIVEFGTSFGISTLYLAAAARETGGRVIASELEQSKAAHAAENFVEAGLTDWIELRQGDALETLREFEAPVELLFLDGWKDLYLPVLRMMEPKLAPGALVIADNIFTFPDELKSYMDAVSDPAGPYRSVVLPFESGLSYSLYQEPENTSS